MDILHLEEFNPPEDLPLVISYVEKARSLGLTTSLAHDHWDFHIFNHADEPFMVVKSVRNYIPKGTLSRLLLEKAPYKVILVDGERPDYALLKSQRVFLASSGTGVFVRGVGWVSKPTGKAVDDVEDLQLKLAKRWKRNELGHWVKACTTCGEFKGTDGFYRSAYRTARDPYRNVCKECMAFNDKIGRAIRKESDGRAA